MVDTTKEAEKERKERELEEKQAQLRREIVKIMMDTSLSEEEKAHKRQALMMGGSTAGKKEEPTTASKKAGKKGSKKKQGQAEAKQESEEEESEEEEPSEEEETFLDDTLKCAMCMNLCERPVTAPCQHNFCLVCFNKWRAQAKYKCPTCRADFPKQFAQNPRINTALILAIRLAKNPPKDKPAPVERRVEEDRPDEAYVTDRAVRSGRANASSGRIMVTAPPDHFGPIGPEYDPERNQGVLVGEWWKDRLDCRQWGAHLPHVAGIAGQSNTGAQSVVLSGGYEDDRDEGEWFLYTGSGGKDLSGNKRTNKAHSFDQTFDKMNKALQLSCTLGLPVRVVRSYKEKRSAYAPTTDTPVRYDGVYRILRCWRKKGQNENHHLICRYLFVRADNSPAPWSSSEGGDQGEQTIPKEAEDEIKEAVGQVYKMSDDPYWAFLQEKGEWGWKKPPPASKKLAGPGRTTDPTKKLKKKLSEQEKVLKEFRCALCKKTLQDPLSTPCNHLYCKGCLEAKFAGVADVQPTNSARSLRVRHVAKPCPCCKADLSSFMAVAQVNREMATVIQKLQDQVAEAQRAVDKAIEEQATQEKSSNEDEEEEEEEEQGVEGNGESRLPAHLSSYGHQGSLAQEAANGEIRPAAVDDAEAAASAALSGPAAAQEPPSTPPATERASLSASPLQHSTASLAATSIATVTTADRTHVATGKAPIQQVHVPTVPGQLSKKAEKRAWKGLPKKSMQGQMALYDKQIKDWIQPTSSPTLPGSFFPARRPFPGERQPREGQQQMQQLLPKDGHGDGGASLTSKTVASVMAALNAWQRFS
uniref:RING-type E3 ubiquitin transferase n=1 Tax=Dunaliella tertiolecta TaxID=3047 RepID=A0A7S3R809_DUNTE